MCNEAMDDEAVDYIITELISGASESIGFLDQAFKASRVGNYTLAEECFDQSDAALKIAHDLQTDMIQKQLNGEPTVVSLFMVHAQDHMMNVFLMKQVVRYLVEIQREINELKNTKEGGKQ